MKHRHKRHKLSLLSVLLSALLIGSSIQLCPLTAVSAAETVNNLVLFAQFDQTEGYNFMEGRADTIREMCSQTDAIRSLYSYIDTISYGAVQTACYFPQMDGDTVQPYIMSQSADSYRSRESVALEILRNITVPDDIPLDGNNDGLFDNIIIIVDASAEQQSDLYWPCAFSLSGIQINGKGTCAVNLHNSQSMFESSVTGGVGVLCHEFLHSLGYPDLYRADSAGAPVGVWDIMASNSIYLQYPLAYMRAAVSGWLDTEDITENGTYTLSPAASDSGNRVYLLKTPVSDTEFFAVEYRQKGQPLSETIDEKIYGSGMVIYRVNTEADGNYKSDKDQIYVFRPDETELNAGEGQLWRSNYGGDGCEDHIGSLDPADGIAEGALVYSDGTNSGIRIENIVMDGETLTFDVQFAEIDAQNLWQTAAGASLNGYTSLDMSASETETVYLAASDGSTADLYRLSDGVFSKISTLNPAQGSVNEIQLTVSGETPYLLYHDYDYHAVLYAYHPADGSWSKIWQSDALAQYSSIAADRSTVYISYTQGTYPDYVLYTVSCEDETVTQLGGIIAENACGLSTVCTATGCAVSFRDLNDQSLPKLAVWEEGVWSIQTLSSLSCNLTSAAADASGITVTLTGNTAGICQIQDGAVSQIEYPALFGACFQALPLYHNGTLLAAINTQNAADCSLYQYDSTWKQLGNSITDEVVHSPAVASSRNQIYFAYIASTGTAFVKYLQYGSSGDSGRITGDLNSDQVFSIADAVLLQKWLLGMQPALADWRAGDCNVDGKLDAADLSLMKQSLLAEGVVR